MGSDIICNREVSQINQNMENMKDYTSIFSIFQSIDTNRLSQEGGMNQKLSMYTPNLQFDDLKVLGVAGETTQKSYFKYFEDKDEFLLCSQRVCFRYDVDEENKINPTNIATAAVAKMNLQFDKAAMDGSVNGYGIINNPNTVTNPAVDGTSTATFINAIAGLEEQMIDATNSPNSNIIYWEAGGVRTKLKNPNGDTTTTGRFMNLNDVTSNVGGVVKDVLNADVIIAIDTNKVQLVTRKMPRLKTTETSHLTTTMFFEMDLPSIKVATESAIIVQPFSAL